MSFLISLLQKLRNLILAIVRIIGKAVCCRKRRHESEMLLPLTISQTPQIIEKHEEVLHNWDDWEGEKKPSSNETVINVDQANSTCTDSNINEEDFFKDMVPQLRKPKKVIINADDDSSHRSSSRLSMDPKNFSASGPDLGLLEEKPSSWESCEEADELWDPISLIKEKKLAEREKRIADHQRRKQEKEANRAKKSTASNEVHSVYSSESKDKSKYS